MAPVIRTEFDASPLIGVAFVTPRTGYVHPIEAVDRPQPYRPLRETSAGVQRGFDGRSVSSLPRAEEDGPVSVDYPGVRWISLRSGTLIGNGGLERIAVTLTE